MVIIYKFDEAIFIRCNISKKRISKKYWVWDFQELGFVDNQQVTFKYPNDKFIKCKGHSRGLIQPK